MITHDGKLTKLQSGDVIVFDTANDMVRLLREDRLFTQEDGDESSYWAVPQDGVQLRQTAKMIADACGLRMEEVKGEDFPTYRLI